MAVNMSSMEPSIVTAGHKAPHLSLLDLRAGPTSRSIKPQRCLMVVRYSQFVRNCRPDTQRSDSRHRKQQHARR